MESLDHNELKIPYKITHCPHCPIANFGDDANNLVNIGSGNDLVPSGSKPLPKPDLRRHMASLGITEPTLDPQSTSAITAEFQC